MARWVAGDEVYRAVPALRAELEFRQVGYVLAIGCDRRVPTDAGPIRADALAAGLPRQAWQRLTPGAGAKGQRYYDWAWASLTPPAGCAPTDIDTDIDTRPGGCWSAATDTGELAFYRCYCPELIPLRELVRVAGRRWTVEKSFQASNGLAGLDEHSTQSVSPSRSVSRQRPVRRPRHGVLNSAPPR